MVIMKALNFQRFQKKEKKILENVKTLLCENEHFTKSHLQIQCPPKHNRLLIFLEIETLSDNLHGTIICVCGTKTEIQTNGTKVKA